MRHAWAEVTNRGLGQLRFGRMPSHWGLGILANDGMGIDADQSSDVDRIMAITKLAGIHLVAAWDFAGQGIQRDLLGDLRGVPYDATAKDDIRQYVFAAARRMDPEEQRDRLQRGSWVLNGGFYFVYRSQGLSSVGQRTAFVCGDTSFTYSDFDRRTNQVASNLLRLGVRKGDRVAILLVNSVEFMEVLLGCAKIGAITIPINVRLAGPEIGYILADSGADVFVFHEPLAAAAVTHAPALTPSFVLRGTACSSLSAASSSAGLSAAGCNWVVVEIGAQATPSVATPNFRIGAAASKGVNKRLSSSHHRTLARAPPPSQLRTRLESGKQAPELSVRQDAPTLVLLTPE